MNEYVKLPVDCDGIPLNFYDKIITFENDDLYKNKVFEVLGYGICENELKDILVFSHDQGYEFLTAKLCKHVNTIE